MTDKFIKVRTHNDCPDDGKIYWPLIGSKEFCTNCTHFSRVPFSTCTLKNTFIPWENCAVCAKWKGGIE